MMLYRGQIMAVAAVLFGALGLLLGYIYVSTPVRLGDLGALLIFSAACISVILALLLAAWSYMYWVPKWERDEKRTGKVPGDRKVKQ